MSEEPPLHQEVVPDPATGEGSIHGAVALSALEHHQEPGGESVPSVEPNESIENTTAQLRQLLEGVDEPTRKQAEAMLAKIDALHASEKATSEQDRQAWEVERTSMEEYLEDARTGVMNINGMDLHFKDTYGISYSKVGVETEDAAQKLPAVMGIGIVDVNELKVANDAKKNGAPIGGHDVGDKLLADTAGTISRVAELFTEHTGLRVTIARVGGDEFAFVIEYPTGMDAEAASSHTRSLQDMLRGELSGPRQNGEGMMDILRRGEQPAPRASIGVATGAITSPSQFKQLIADRKAAVGVMPDEEEKKPEVTTFELLQQAADQAMYDAKAEMVAKGIVTSRDISSETTQEEIRALVESDMSIVKQQRKHDIAAFYGRIATNATKALYHARRAA